jgi:hypothetical protein
MRNESAMFVTRLLAAKSAAPYCHRALKAMEHTGLKTWPN